MLQVLNVTGNQDLCYYNFKCARRLGVLSSFNSFYSNIGYAMLGILFLALTYRKFVSSTFALRRYAANLVFCLL